MMAQKGMKYCRMLHFENMLSERSKTTYYMILFIGNIRNRQMCRDRKYISYWQMPRERGKGHRVFSGNDENILRWDNRVAYCRVQSTEGSSACMGPFEGGHHYLHYLHHSMTSGQATGREHSPTHQQKMGLKIYWTWPCPSEQDSGSPSVSLSHQEPSISLLSLSKRGQFSSVAQSCPTLCDPMNCSTPGLPVHHKLPEFTQTHAHRVSDAIQPSHPLSSPPPPAPNPSQHQRLFQWVNSLHEVAKVLEFKL